MSKEQEMLTMLSQNWWLVALRGVAAVLFGIATFLSPQTSLLFLVLLFGAYSLVDGVAALVAGLRINGPSGRPWGLILEGIAGIIVGILTFVWPGLTELALLYLIAAWALLTGGLEIWAAIALRREIDNEWLLVLAGAASILFGVIVAVSPGSGAFGIITVIGAYALIFGFLLIVLGFKLKGLASSGGWTSSAAPGHA
jgi:uncharacterized membrane protein HdeD (DUF308 family)